MIIGIYAGAFPTLVQARVLRPFHIAFPVAPGHKGNVPGPFEGFFSCFFRSGIPLILK
jgi:hypothetical protein